ncbi:uncharacterized protein LY89DRAFT_672713 [Mollisia scopiformis]|uniref:2EXR domain-containing protein n=1 Tax=Mollisia scopiformis TaxID=149040 RepID=A0A194WZY3_MOLSC|nr:uncharacterized protein LY89DRAFT_672713 [Mollisia scopiformis]KUJ13505.1 hypothetical protein LY89DRAFT_672713 [Mollisia scopiformis]
MARNTRAHAKAVIAQQSPSVPPALTLTEFKKFNELPVELRLIIWSMAAPPPATISQHISRVKGRGHYWNRAGGIPAVLHACAESRREYLEYDTDDETTKVAFEGRRRDHPLYKLHFKNRLKASAGCYMSLEIDTYWPARAQELKEYRSDISGEPELSKFRTAAELDIASGLQHLALLQHDRPEDCVDFDDLLYFAKKCPLLKTLTVVLQSRRNEESWRVRGGLYTPEVMGPWGLEVSLEVDEVTFESNRAKRTRELITEMEEMMKDHPEKSFPFMKLRIQFQFSQAEKLEPLKDIWRRNKYRHSQKVVKGSATWTGRLRPEASLPKSDSRQEREIEELDSD